MNDAKIRIIRQNQSRKYGYETSFLCAMQAYTNIKAAPFQFIAKMKSVGKLIMVRPAKIYFDKTLQFFANVHHVHSIYLPPNFICLIPS